jgi:hypothetical protein
VLVIDNLDLLVAIEQAVVEDLVSFWFGSRLLDLTGANTQGDRELSDHLDEFIEQLRDHQHTTRDRHSPNALLEGLGSFCELLHAPSISNVAEAALIETAQRVLEELQADQAEPRDVIGRMQQAASSQETREQLLSDLQRLMQIRRVLDKALRAVAERRSACRIAVLASQMPEGLLSVQLRIHLSGAPSYGAR